LKIDGRPNLGIVVRGAIEEGMDGWMGVEENFELYLFFLDI
jgi:hypothetical protein